MSNKTNDIVYEMLQNTLRIQDGKVVYTEEAARELSSFIKERCITFCQFVGCEEPEMDAIYEVFERLG